MAHLNSKNQRRDLGGALLAYGSQGSGSTTPRHPWYLQQGMVHAGVAEMLWMLLILLEELQQGFLKETREMQTCAKRGGKYLW